MSKVWYITGASKGLGLESIIQLLEVGDFIAATSRDKTKLVENVKKELVANGKPELVDKLPTHFLALEVDLVNESSVKQSIADTLGKFNKIDVLMNNAGYGLAGGIEELSDREIRDQYDCNVFGILNVLRHSLAHLRSNALTRHQNKQDTVKVIILSSIGGFNTRVPFTSYCSSKFALEGLSEGLQAELKPFHIDVVAVKPGGFRTHFLSDSLMTVENPIQDYKEIRDAIETRKNVDNGKQPGDPKKCVSSIIKVANLQTAPLHMFLGSDAYARAHAKIQSILNDLEKYKDITLSTDF